MTTIAEDDPRLVFIPIAEAATPPGGLIEHLKDRWWQVHPVKGLVFWKTKGHLFPQCNPNTAVAESIQSRMYPWAEVRFIPSVFRHVDPKDYV